MDLKHYWEEQAGEFGISSQEQMILLCGFVK